jgi:hypothetical protein
MILCSPLMPTPMNVNGGGGTHRDQSPRIFHGSACAFRDSFRRELPNSDFGMMQKAFVYWAFDGGRTRDRTLDLSRVKGWPCLALSTS